MLEREPTGADGTDNEPSTTTSAGEGSPDAADTPVRPRRRRAASRPAGPPQAGVDSDVPADDVPAGDVPADDVPSGTAPPARRARKRAVRAAAQPIDAAQPTDVVTESATIAPQAPETIEPAAPVRSRARRARKTAVGTSPDLEAPPAPVAAMPVDAGDQTGDDETGDDQTGDGDRPSLEGTAMAVFSPPKLFFQPPQPLPSMRPGRRASATEAVSYTHLTLPTTPYV